ncbi:hypothetical protein OEZ85_014073 [Tetradesmus obliquus]|uniref:Uncharacterized protein n=1 Tax=Tetradesmus obliquus TaxID=3088 RepID=A0ABY8U780_TETOB|nr:hypothetical protein OEZ85_014073 [Tetradesmus obliquus]
MGKRRYITFKVDEELGDVPGLSSYGPAREPLGVRCGRCMRFTGFCLVCTGTLFQALAPWMLSVIEVATLLLLLLLLLLPAHPPGPYDFRFDSSLEDVAVLGAARAASISATYAYGSKRYQLRPYLITSYVLGCAGFVYALLKAAYFAWPLAWLPPAGMLLTFGCFSWLHILAARHTVTWARRQGMLGLAPFNPLAGGIIR